MEQDQKFLEHVVSQLVDHPEDVKITRTVDQLGVLLMLSVHKDDMGKVIGRSGATAKAIRTLLRVVGMKNDARVNLKIDEPEGSTRGAAMSDSEEGDTDDVGSMADVPHRERKQQEPQMRELDDVLGDLKV